MLVDVQGDLSIIIDTMILAGCFGGYTSTRMLRESFFDQDVGVVTRKILNRAIIISCTGGGLEAVRSL